MLKAAVADTIFSSGTWNRITNTPTIHATTNIAINTLNFYSATFTAGNIGDTCLGVFIHISNVGTGGTWTIGLQQNSITVATANTRAVSTLNGITNQWVYFAFPTPFAFTSTSAGYYRFVVTVAGSTGSNGLAADSSGTLFSYLAVDNRSAGKPVSGDDIWVGGDSAVVTLTMDGTQTVGSRAGTAQYSTRTVTHAVNICFNAKILWDTAASASLTCRGGFIVNNSGEIEIGNATNAYPTGKTASLIISGAVTGDHAIIFYTSATVKLYGLPTTAYKTNWVSGIGSTASPLITSEAVAWAANDLIQISGNAYNTYETKYIKTVNSTTSYTLSDAAGGAEVPLSNTHYATDFILNYSNNVNITSDNSAISFYLRNYGTLNLVNMHYVSFKYTNTFYLTYNATAHMIMSHCSIFDPINPLYLNNSNTAVSITDVIVGLQVSNTSTSNSMYIGLAKNVTITNLYMIGSNRNNLVLIATNCNLTNIYIRNCTRGSATAYGGIVISNSPGTVIDNLQIDACRSNSILFDVSSVNCIIKNSEFGAIYPSVNDFSLTDSIFLDVRFINCTFSSTNMFNALVPYTSLSVGSKIKIETEDGTPNKHSWYTPQGSWCATGTGLPDSNVRTAGSLALRGAPEDATDGNQWEFKILAKAGTQTYCAGFAKKAAGLVGKVANVKLYLPGSVAPDATTVLTDNTNWNSWMVAANYTGTLDLYATVRITIFSTVSTDYLYIDDLYNGTNKITALDTWDQGMPSPIMFEQLGDAAAVWATIEGSAVFKLLGNKVTKSGDVITIYEDDGITTWREYDLASGGRALV